MGPRVLSESGEALWRDKKPLAYLSIPHHYWRVQTGATEPQALNGGLTYRAIPDLNGWMLFVNVTSLDETVARIQSLGGSIVRPKTAVPRTAWVTIAADPAKNIFGVWQADPSAFPTPEPD